MNLFHHLRFVPVSKMKKKNKTSHKNPSNKAHKNKPTQEPNSKPSSSRHSCHSTPAAVQATPDTETPTPASKRVKLEDGLRDEMEGRGTAQHSARRPQSESQSQPVRSAGVLSHTRVSVFTDADDIIILRSMIEFAKSKNVSLPLDTLRDFYPFLNGKLSCNVTNSQIYDKIRRLKIKYLNWLQKSVVFSSKHEYEVFKLCHKIWADDERERAVVDDTDEPDEMESEIGKEAFSSKYPLLMESLDWDNSSSFSKMDSVKQNMHLIGSEKATELELIWMELQSKDAEIHSKRANFKTELIRMVLNAKKQGGGGGGGEPSSSAAARANAI